MTDDELTAYLDDNGYPEHIVAGGGPGLIRRWWSSFRKWSRDTSTGCMITGTISIFAAIALSGLDEDPAVQSADERLRQVLTPARERVWESTPGEAFWDFGYPQNARGTAKGFGSSGLVAERGRDVARVK